VFRRLINFDAKVQSFLRIVKANVNEAKELKYLKVALSRVEFEKRNEMLADQVLLEEDEVILLENALEKLKSDLRVFLEDLEGDKY
jgi:hypothetical protein